MDDRPSRKTFRATCDLCIARGVAFYHDLAAQWAVIPVKARWLWSVLNALAAIVFVRRLFSDSTPSGSVRVVVIGSLLAGASLLARLLCERPDRRLSERTLRWWALALSAGPMLILLCTSRTSPFGVGCLLALFGYVLVGIWHWSRTAGPLWFETVPVPEQVSAPIDPLASIRETDPAESQVELAEEPGESPQQWLSRTSPGPDEDFLEGTLRSEFVAGQKLLFVHVPFSPPFLAVPELECEVQADGDVRHKVAAIYRYGARIELRRSAMLSRAEPVELHIAASLTRPADAA